MTVGRAITKWLNDTRDEFGSGADQREALARALDAFMTSKALGPELDEFLQLDALVRRLRAAEVPTEELGRALAEVYLQRSAAVATGDLEAYVHEMTVQDGAGGALNTFGGLVAAYSVPARRFTVAYRIVLVGGGGSTGSCSVEARTRCEAEGKARAWVERFDPHFDARFGTTVTFTDVADSAGEEDNTNGETE